MNTNCSCNSNSGIQLYIVYIGISNASIVQSEEYANKIKEKTRDLSKVGLVIYIPTMDMVFGSTRVERLA
jgi:hypothetical protein